MGLPSKSSCQGLGRNTDRGPSLGSWMLHTFLKYLHKWLNGRALTTYRKLGKLGGSELCTENLVSGL